MNNDTYYVVKKGYNIGIFKNWGECKKSIDGYKNPIFRKFSTFEEAKDFLKNGKTINIIDKTIKVNNNKLKEDNKNNVDEKPNHLLINNIDKSSDKSSDTIISDEEIIKIKKSISTLKSSQYSDDLNYNVKGWTIIDDEIYIFTDGSSRKSKTKEDYFNSGVGVYIGLNCTNIKEQYKDKTNNQCELMGMDYAFKLIVKYYRELVELNKVVKIVSDSEYTIKACSVWLTAWKKNNWRTAKGEDVKNKELIESIDASMLRIKLINSKITSSNKIKVKLIHVNSHQEMDRTNRTKFNIWFGNLCADGLACNKL
jgi:ribonuclease HI